MAELSRFMTPPLARQRDWWAQVPFSPLWPTLAAGLAAAGLNLRSGHAVARCEAGVFLAGLGVIGVLAAGFAAVDVTMVGTDGFWTVYLANELYLNGRFSVDTRFLLLSKEPLFQALIQSAAPVFGKVYFTALQPLFGISGLAACVVLARRCLRAGGMASGAATGLALLCAAALATTPIVVVHALILKAHGFSCTITWSPSLPSTWPRSSGRRPGSSWRCCSLRS